MGNEDQFYAMKITSGQRTPNPFRSHLQVIAFAWDTASAGVEGVGIEPMPRLYLGIAPMRPRRT